MIHGVRDSRVRIYERTTRLQYSCSRCIQFVVRMQEEEDIQCLLEHWVRDVVLLAGVIHLVKEPDMKYVMSTGDAKTGCHGNDGAYDPV
jgi:hypothetical protein